MVPGFPGLPKPSFVKVLGAPRAQWFHWSPNEWFHIDNWGATDKKFPYNGAIEEVNLSDVSMTTIRHTWYLSFFYTSICWGLKILHSKYINLHTKIASKLYFWVHFDFFTLSQKIYTSLTNPFTLKNWQLSWLSVIHICWIVDELLIIDSVWDQTHVQKICCKYSIIIKGFLATWNWYERLFKGKNVSNWR